LQENRAALTPEQQGRLDRADAKAKTTIYALRTRFHDLLRRELKSRNDQLAWDMELRKVREEKEADHAELKNRQVIAIIRDELNAPAPVQPLVRLATARLALKIERGLGGLSEFIRISISFDRLDPLNPRSIFIVDRANVFVCPVG
jgi:hypothetical protein